MSQHVFGGEWTEQKLERVRKYLAAYTTIFSRNVGARFFTTHYVDAFAGTGYRADLNEGDDELLVDIYDADRERLQKGSAVNALEVEPPFGHYLFIEKSPGRVAELEKLPHRFQNRRIEIRRAEANLALQEWCGKINWHENRAVVFLDPYGMQVDWATLQSIAGTRAIDVWILFPIGMAVNRLLVRDNPPPPEWAERLTRSWGTEDWRNEFYKKRRESGLFEQIESERRFGGIEQIGEFFLSRLRTIFAGVAPNPRLLLNSGGQPIYLLCFAAGNEKGAKTAVRIATDLLKGN